MGSLAMGSLAMGSLAIALFTRYPLTMAVPAAVRAHFEVPLKYTVARLIPQQLDTGSQISAASGAGSRTFVEVVAAVQLSGLTFLGPVRWIAPPGWLIRLIVGILIPYVWQQFLQILATLRDPSNPWAVRIRADAAGMYAFLAGAPPRLLQVDGRSLATSPTSSPTSSPADLPQTLGVEESHTGSARLPPDPRGSGRAGKGARRGGDRSAALAGQPVPLAPHSPQRGETGGKRHCRWTDAFCSCLQ